MSEARLKAQNAQQRRLELLQPRCPCGEKCWPCNCPFIAGLAVIKTDEASCYDQCSHLLPATPVFFDEGKTER